LAFLKGVSHSPPQDQTWYKGRLEIDDNDWDRINNIFPVQVIGPQGGRPQANNRRVFEALIWFARAGCPWEYMPKNFPSWSTCRRRLLEWEEQGNIVKQRSMVVESSANEVHHLRKNHLTCVHLADSKDKKAEKRIPN